MSLIPKEIKQAGAGMDELNSINQPILSAAISSFFEDQQLNLRDVQQLLQQISLNTDSTQMLFENGFISTDSFNISLEFDHDNNLNFFWIEDKNHGQIILYKDEQVAVFTTQEPVRRNSLQSASDNPLAKISYIKRDVGLLLTATASLERSLMPQFSEVPPTISFQLNLGLSFNDFYQQTSEYFMNSQTGALTQETDRDESFFQDSSIYFYFGLTSFQDDLNPFGGIGFSKSF